MKMLRPVLFVALSILVLGSILTLVLPSHGHSEIVFLIHQPAAVVYPRTMTPRLVARWNPFHRALPVTSLHFAGADSGETATYDWRDPDGSGGIFLVTSTVPLLETDFQTRIRGRWESGSFQLRPVAGGKETWVKWIMEYKAGILPWDRFYALAFGTVMGPAMNSGAEALQKACGDSGAD